jgi:hypothetical protein
MPEKSANVLVSRDLLTSNASILWVCNRCSGRYQPPAPAMRNSYGTHDSHDSKYFAQLPRKVIKCDQTPDPPTLLAARTLSDGHAPYARL